MASSSLECDSPDYAKKILEQIDFTDFSKFTAKQVGDNQIQFEKGESLYILSFNKEEQDKYKMDKGPSDFNIKLLGVGTGSMRNIVYFKEAIPDHTGQYVKCYKIKKRVEFSYGKFLVFLLSDHLICIPTGKHHLHSSCEDIIHDKILDYGEETDIDKVTSVIDIKEIVNNKYLSQSVSNDPIIPQHCINMPTDPIDYMESIY